MIAGKVLFMDFSQKTFYLQLYSLFINQLHRSTQTCQYKLTDQSKINQIIDKKCTTNCDSSPANIQKFQDFFRMSQHHPHFSQTSQPPLEQYTYHDESLRTPIKKMAQTQFDQSHTEQTLQKQPNQKNQVLNSTPRPQRKIVLYDEHNQKHFFPLYRDKDIGIDKQYQEIVIDSWNDDDKKTSSTQMRRGMHQTMQDLKDVFGDSSSSQSSGYYD